MKYIRDFNEGENVIGHYYCKQKQQLKSKNGKSYISLKLQDKTGIADAKIWEINNNIQTFEDNCVVKIDAVIQLFNGEIQLNIKKLRKSNDGEYDPADLMPSTDKDIKALQERLSGFIASVDNEYLRALLENIIVKNEMIYLTLSKHSAAKAMHHSYMGGLLEHTVSVVEICDFIAPRYKKVNRDLLICAAALHDICKVFELSPLPENDYTDEGQLLGHIYMTAELINKEAAKIDGFPPKLESLLKHCILSHHGEYEFGSPKRPKIIEAYILHAADDLDAKAQVFEQFIEQNTNENLWAGYHKLLARNIRASDYE